MSLEKHHIVDLQEKYIQTEDEQYLEDLYVELLKIGFFSLRKKRFFTDTGKDIENIVFDVVQYVVMRLCTEKRVVIEYAPYKYMEQAIYYSSMPAYKKVYQLKDEHLEGTHIQSAEDEYINKVADEEIERGINKIIRIDTADLQDEDREYIKEKVFTCMAGTKPYQKSIYKVRKRYRPLFINIMEDIRTMLKERA